MAADPAPDAPPPDDADQAVAGATAAELLTRLLRGATACPADVVAVAQALCAVTESVITGDQMPGAVLSDRFVVLARLRTLLDGEMSRSSAAAEARDVLPYTPSGTLQKEAGWTKSDATALATAARFADRHPDLATIWRAGGVATGVVATLARGLGGVTAEAEDHVVAAVVPCIDEFSVASMRVLVSQALDLLNPDQRDKAEQCDYDRRRVDYTQHGGMVMINADLPDMEGAAVISALKALGESLRVEGDGLTSAQRMADALITLVNTAAAHDDLPATAGGLPVGVTITMGARDADRVASGAARRPVTDLNSTVEAGADPASIPATTGTTPATLGDAATRFALCTGTWTGVILDDAHRAATPISTALINNHSQPLAVGRTHRFATPAQRTALAVRDGGCILCHRPPAESQTHHLTDWADGGTTDLDQLTLLCWVHHRQVDLNRWTLSRNPDPHGPFWIITATPRHRWRRRDNR